MPAIFTCWSVPTSLNILVKHSIGDQMSSLTICVKPPEEDMVVSFHIKYLVGKEIRYFLYLLYILYLLYSVFTVFTELSVLTAFAVFTIFVVSTLFIEFVLKIKASEMLVAPRISECFGLPWSALVCYSLPFSAIVCLGLL